MQLKTGLSVSVSFRRVHLLVHSTDLEEYWFNIVDNSKRLCSQRLQQYVDFSDNFNIMQTDDAAGFSDYGSQAPRSEEVPESQRRRDERRNGIWCTNQRISMNLSLGKSLPFKFWLSTLS